eukprot:TRINITY_DN2218_c0_g1_i1.p1 TRINITY_DN2218_c0_g1~~TRINITY_DN2218_c0_g1_i1.p1  ORF type:complete len:195 (+),score=47.09 TRINITY_DN2218_c0_g1_i1:367-951(+)
MQNRFAMDFMVLAVFELFSALFIMLRRASTLASRFVAPIPAARHNPLRRYATEAAAVDDGLLSLSLVLPSKPLFQDRKVRMVVIPAASGMMGILKNHVPTIAPLKPGVVTIDEGGKQEKVFVSGGFAIVNTDKTCQISAIEAVPVDHIDPEAARSGLTHYQGEFARATVEEDKARARIGLEVHQQMCYALGLSV